MVKSTILTREEEEILEEHYRKCQTTLIRSRAHAILLHNQDYHIPEIAKILRYEEKTVRNWIHSFKETRISSIFPKYVDNQNASKLTQQQKEEIQKTLASPPHDHGLPSVFWSVKEFKEYLNAEYGIIYESDRSYHHIFAVSGYSFKLPGGVDIRRNDELVKKRMAQIQRKIKEFKAKGYRVFAADECSLSWVTELRRAWIQQGEKTVIKINRDKTRQNYFGALNLENHKHELIPLAWQDTLNIIGALRELKKRYANQKLCLIWDNAKWHRSRELRSLLGKKKEFEHFYFLWLPPYAPDENPQEHVWKIGKDAAANTYTKTFQELKDIFEKSISNKIFNYEIR